MCESPRGLDPQVSSRSSGLQSSPPQRGYCCHGNWWRQLAHVLSDIIFPLFQISSEARWPAPPAAPLAYREEPGSPEHNLCIWAKR